jgi:hypothetical protein
MCATSGNCTDPVSVVVRRVNAKEEKEEFLEVIPTHNTRHRAFGLGDTDQDEVGCDSEDLYILGAYVKSYSKQEIGTHYSCCNCQYS